MLVPAVPDRLHVPIREAEFVISAFFLSGRMLRDPHAGVSLAVSIDTPPSPGMLTVIGAILVELILSSRGRPSLIH